MKRTAVALCVLSLLFGAATMAATEQPKITTANGQVVSADAQSNTLLVKVENTPGQGKDMTFLVNHETKILKAGGPIGLDDVQAGDKVTVNFKTVNGKNMAVSIGVEPKA